MSFGGGANCEWRAPTRREALTAAMVLAPGVFARNRMFAFFANPDVKQARGRAGLLLGIVRQLGRAAAIRVVEEQAAPSPRWALHYDVPTLNLHRTARLSRVELAALRVAVSRASVAGLVADEDDRAIVGGALSQLLACGDESSALASAAAERT